MTFTKLANLTEAELVVRLDPPPPGAQPCSMLDETGQTWHGYEMRNGHLHALTKVTFTAEELAAQAARQAAQDAATAAEGTRVNQIRALLNALDAGTATNAQVQNALARVIRFVRANVAQT